MIYKSLLTYEQYLSLLKVLLSWPPIVFTIVVVILIKYKDYLAEWIKDRNINFKAPGGMEVSFNQTQKETKPITTPMVEKISEETKELINDYISKLKEDLDNTKNEKEYIIQEFSKQLTTAYNNAEFWEFRYLNEILVANTKIILYWINEYFPSEEEYHLQFKHISKDQRSIILEVLQSNGLITKHDKIFISTSRGKQFIFFLNWMKDYFGPEGAISDRERALKEAAATSD